MLELKLDQYSGKRKLYQNTDLKINEGITVLIGNNGTGKTYCCSQIKDAYKHALFIDIVDETIRNTVDFRQEKSLGRWITASEGQRVYDNLEFLATSIGQYVSLCKSKNQSVIIIIDGADSGVSIDLIQNIRGFLDLVNKDCKKNKQEHYIIVTANNYELAVDYESIWIPTLDKYNFKLSNKNDYYKFRKLYLDNNS